jgi:hypothetical protein
MPGFCYVRKRVPEGGSIPGLHAPLRMLLTIGISVEQRSSVPLGRSPTLQGTRQYLPGYSQPSLRDKEVRPIATQTSPNVGAYGPQPDGEFERGARRPSAGSLLLRLRIVID